MAVDTPSAQPVVREATAAALMLSAEAVDATATCGTVFTLLAQNQDWPGVAITGPNGTILGLVDRPTLLMTFAQPLLHDLFERRPVTRLMDTAPLVIDAATDLATISDRIRREKPEAMARGFVIARDGRYAGLGSSLMLMSQIAAQASHRSAMLEEARYAAEAASRAKSSFLANLSHELRTPLNAVIGFADLLESEFLGPLGNDRYREYVGDIRSSGRHLLGLINDLLDLAKAEADRLTLIDERLDVAVLAASCLRLIGDQAARGGVVLKPALPADLPALRADPGKLRQILLNLLSNAVKFTPTGGEVRITAGLDVERRLVLTVADTGIGMTAAEIERAMEPFTQIDSMLSRRHRGTGLGLPLTRRLVELHGGTLAIEAAPGLGTRVAVLFPAARVDPSHDAERLAAG